MRNPFEKAKTWWVRYSDYQWRTAEDGTLCITPAPGATFTLYDAMEVMEQLVLDALNVGRQLMGKAPNAFFLRRNNLYPKFVLNRCGAVSTDTMHRMKFNEGVNPDNILLAYYNSISFAFTELCGRSYGGGVLEILPGEMGNIMIPVLDEISVDVRDELLREVDKIVREEGNIEDALDLVDQEALVNLLGIDPAWCRECRAIWKKLQRRRLGRGEQ